MKTVIPGTCCYSTVERAYALEQGTALLSTIAQRENELLAASLRIENDAKPLLQQAIEELAKDAAAAFKGPTKWTDAEAAAGNMGIRWVNAEGVHGRPTECDVRQYLVSTPTARGCDCPDCRQFYTQETPAIEAAQAEQHDK